MGIYIKKSVRFGPVRLNISKSGIGVSTGIKGARISTGPRGTYIHVGRNGIYYRQRIGGLADDHWSPHVSSPDSGLKSAVNKDHTDGINIDDLVESSNEDLLELINSRIQQPAHAVGIRVVSIVVAGIAASLAYVAYANANTVPSGAYPFAIALPLFLAAVVLTTGLFLAGVTDRRERLEKITALQYALDHEAKARFASLQNALAELATSACAWHVVAQESTWDWKRNAGASSLVTRKRIGIGQIDPRFLQTEGRVYGIQFDSMQLFFLPDQVYVFQGGRYGAVSYNTLKAGVSSTRFIETETVPSDATVVDRTWRYVRKDGGPDMRFRNNRQIPVVEYGHIELSLQPETTLHLYVSSLERVRQFGDALHDYQRHCRNLAGSAARTDKQPKQRPKAKVSNESKDESPYAILNVSPSASKEEIVAAYRQAAKMWHPDRVAGLAPEFRELAEKRMKAVNAAYETLMRRTSAE